MRPGSCVVMGDEEYIHPIHGKLLLKRSNNTSGFKHVIKVNHREYGHVFYAKLRVNQDAKEQTVLLGGELLTARDAALRVALFQLGVETDSEEPNKVILPCPRPTAPLCCLWPLPQSPV